MTIEELIRRADGWLKTNRPDYYATLRPGVAPSALDAYEAQFALKLPFELRAIYQWRDGQDPGSDEALVHNHMFMSLAQSAATKAMLDGMIGFDFEDPNWWRRGWVPFTVSYGGDSYCVDLDAAAGAEAGRVIDFWHDAAERPVLAPNFVTWFAELVTAMEDGRLELA